jgi:prepilin-type processing-associated H-X9-DG protein
VIAIIGVLIALLLPAVQAAREAARRMQCGNKIKQLALAGHNFHDANNRFPNYSNDSHFSTKRLQHFTFYYSLLPFMEQTAVYDQVIALSPGPTTETAVSSANTHTTEVYAVTRCKWGFLLCPSDGNTSKWATGDDLVSNYLGSLGDMVVRIGNSGRAISGRSWLRQGFYEATGTVTNSVRSGAEVTFAAITDGTSNTVMFTEGIAWDKSPNGTAGANYKSNMAAGSGLTLDLNRVPNECLGAKGSNNSMATGWAAYVDSESRPGFRAQVSHSTYGNAIYTLLPPNSPSCTTASYPNPWGGRSASSNHQGGVNVAFLDGSVHFVSETINTKNFDVKMNFPSGTYDAPTIPIAANAGASVAVGEVFSYGVWAELGSICGGESAQIP